MNHDASTECGLTKNHSLIIHLLTVLYRTESRGEYGVRLEFLIKRVLFLFQHMTDSY